MIPRHSPRSFATAKASTCRWSKFPTALMIGEYRANVEAIPRAPQNPKAQHKAQPSVLRHGASAVLRPRSVSRGGRLTH